MPDLLFVEAKIDELEAVLAVGAERADQAGGGALRGRGGVVELVGQVAGQLAEGGKLFSLLLDAGDFAHAVEQGGDDALGHGGDGLEHLRKDELGESAAPRPARWRIPARRSSSCARRAARRSFVRRGR